MNSDKKVLDYDGLATLVALIRNLYPLKTDVTSEIASTLSEGGYATEDYIDSLVGDINTVLATLTTVSGGGE
jgi:hypothetical protein